MRRIFLSVGIFALALQLTACGGGDGTTPTPTPTPTPLPTPTARTANFVFTANWEDDSVSTYIADTRSGRLSFISKASTGVGTHPYEVAVDPTGKFAYTANAFSNDVTAFAISPSGMLTAINCVASGSTVCSGTKYQAGSGPGAITVDPTGKYVLVANWGGDDTISQYAIQPDGSLMTMSSISLVSGAQPYKITFNALGNHMYVANWGTGDISAFTMDANGVATVISCGNDPGLCNGDYFKAGPNARSFTLDPTETHAYVANWTDCANPCPTPIYGTISQYTINADGSLTPMTPATVDTYVNPVSVTIDPTGQYAYVANSGSSVVAQYTIDPTNGTLSPMPDPYIYAGTGTWSVVVDPTGARAYTLNRDSNDISQFSITADGSLLAAAPEVVPTEKNPRSMLMLSRSVRATPRFAYAANKGSSNDISQYTIGSSGVLSAMATPVVAAGNNPAAIITTTDNKYAYAVNYGSGDISAYTINASGALLHSDCVSSATVVCNGINYAAGMNPAAMGIHPSGNYAYVVNSGNGNVSQYTIGADGSLITMTTATVPADTDADAISLDPSGRYAYVTNRGANTISQYTINPDGSLSAMSTASVATGSTPVALTIDPTGKFAYVINSADNNISQYLIASNGSLASQPPQNFATGNTPAAVAIDPAGRYAYVVNQIDNTVSQYKIETNGSLTAINTTLATTGSTPVAVTVDISGNFVYVTNRDSHDVSQFQIDSDGSLLLISTTNVPAGNSPAAITSTGIYH